MCKTKNEDIMHDCMWPTSILFGRRVLLRLVCFSSVSRLRTLLQVMHSDWDWNFCAHCRPRYKTTQFRTKPWSIYLNEGENSTDHLTENMRADRDNCDVSKSIPTCIASQSISLNNKHRDIGKHSEKPCHSFWARPDFLSSGPSVYR